MRTVTWAMAGAALALAGCGDAPAGNEAATSATAPSGDCSASEKLAGTGLCPSQALALLSGDPATAGEAPEGCLWKVMEAAMPAGEYLLYRGLECGDKATRIEFAAGAHRAELELADSAFLGPMDPPPILGAVYSIEGDPLAAVTQRASEAVEDPAQFKGCAARKADIDGWPADALVVDVPAAEAARIPEDDGPRTACGPLGLDEDAIVFWRASQGYAWYFNLGQDAVEIDPGTVTVVRKGDGGEWEVAPAFTP